MPGGRSGRADKPATTAPITDSLHGAKPFRRRSVRGIGADIFVEKLEPNSVGVHRHPEWQVAIVSQGSAIDATMRRPGGKTKKRRIIGGEVWILPPGWQHSVRWREPAILIVLYIEERWIRNYYPQLRQMSSVAKLTEYVAALPVIAELCRELRQFAEVPNGQTDWRVAAAGSHLATVLLQAHLVLADGIFRPPSAMVGKILENLRRHLIERSHERLPLSEMARRFGASDRHLRRIFRRAMGISPQEWLIIEKVKQAAHLLIEGQSVKQTVEAAGFTSESHLHRAMLRVYGISPTAFRKQAQAAAIPFRA